MSEAPATTSQPPTHLPKKGELLDLTIDSLAYGGKGVARRDGFVVFVQRALPGQKVRVRITLRRKGYAEGRVEELLQPFMPSWVRSKRPSACWKGPMKIPLDG